MQGKIALGHVPCFGYRRHHHRRSDGKSGSTGLGLLYGTHEEFLGELRQT